MFGLIRKSKVKSDLEKEIDRLYGVLKTSSNEDYWMAQIRALRKVKRNLG